MRLILLGSPGAGKGTQAKFITKAFNIPQVATGDMLRAAVKAGSALGERVKKIMDAGELVPDDVIIELVKSRIAENDCAKGYLLDGFPRTLKQAQAITEANIPLDFVIEIKVDNDIIVDRMSGRMVHPGSGRVYHVRYNPPKVEGKDDVTGEALIHRADDDEVTVRKRLDVYNRQTKPLVQYYKTRSEQVGSPHFESVVGVGAVAEIRDKVLSILSSVDVHK